MTLALAVVEAIRDDPEARAELRSLLAPESNGPEAPGYTVEKLSDLSGIPKATIRAACRSGHLKARRLGTGKRAPYVIEAPSATRWISQLPEAATTPTAKRRLPRATTRANGSLHREISAVFFGSAEDE